MATPTDKATVPGKVWVQWPNGKTYCYSVGYEGRVDLSLRQTKDSSTAGGSYQPNTLPVLKLPNTAPMRVGERVKITSNVEFLREMQITHGEWNSKMEEVYAMDNSFLSIDSIPNFVSLLMLFLIIQACRESGNN